MPDSREIQLELARTIIRLVVASGVRDIRAELVEADGVEADRKWPPELYQEYLARKSSDG